MALTISVTKKSVSKRAAALWDITLNLTCSELGVAKINKDFTIHYGSGQSAEATVKKLQVDMQAAIDDYKAEQVILNHATLEAGITYLNTYLAG